MRSKPLASVVLVLTLALSGCYRTVVRTGAPAEGPMKHSTGLTFLYGLTPVEHGAVECPNGIASAETNLAWYNFLLIPLTAGLVASTESHYVCAAGENDEHRTSAAR